MTISGFQAGVGKMHIKGYSHKTTLYFWLKPVLFFLCYTGLKAGDSYKKLNIKILSSFLVTKINI
jgi:hypothetical protein